MSTGHAEHDSVPLRARCVGYVHTEADHVDVTVDHLYAPEGAFPCDECGEPGHDPGLVGLALSDGDDHASAMLTAEEALVLANRLTRAASLVLESAEDMPDLDREAAKFGTPQEPAP